MNGHNRELFGHLAVALGRYAKELRRDGITPPPELLSVLAFVMDCASVRQEATSVDPSLRTGDGGAMSTLLLTKREAAGELRTSVRQLERVLADPDSGLDVVRIGGSVRIRRADLDSYVAALGRPASFREQVEEKSA